jgi:hypothetical protein
MVSGQLHAPTALPTRKASPVPIGWVGPKASFDGMKEWKFLTLPGLELQLLGRPVRSQLLYRGPGIIYMHGMVLEFDYGSFELQERLVSTWHQTW